MNVVGPPVIAVSRGFRVPLVAQTIVNQVPETVTGSENVTVTSVVVVVVAPSIGVVAVTAGAASIVKPKATSAASVSGGSPASTSLTAAAAIVTVQASPATKSAFGSMVNVVGPPVTTVSATVRVPLGRRRSGTRWRRPSPAR